MIASPMLALVVAGRWRPGMVDPSPWTWGVVLAFLAAGACCAKRARRPPGRAAWAAVAGLGLFLAADKVLDLQNGISQVGRDLASGSGRYAGRRPLQAILLAAIATATIAAVAWAARRRRGATPAIVVALAVSGFYVGRCLSFHALDAALSTHLIAGGPTLNAAIEIAAALGILAAACLGTRG